MSIVKLVVFDIAGTIIEDHGEVIDAFCTALAANGMPVSAADLKEFRSASKREVITRFAQLHWSDDPGNPERIDRTYAAFCSELEGMYANGGVKPIAGAASSFAWLKAHDVLCATTTGFYRAVTDQILGAAGWLDQLVAGRAGRSGQRRILHSVARCGNGVLRRF